MVLVLRTYQQTSVFADAAAATKAAKIFEGSSNGTFDAKDNLTREQMASVLVRAFNLKPISGVNVTINDLDQISTSHVDDVRILYQNEVTKGKLDGGYDPKDGVTRAEFSVFMYRALLEHQFHILMTLKLRFQKMTKINHLKTINQNQRKKKAINRIKMSRKKSPLH